MIILDYGIGLIEYWVWSKFLLYSSLHLILFHILKYWNPTNELSEPREINWKQCKVWREIAHHCQILFQQFFLIKPFAHIKFHHLISRVQRPYPYNHHWNKDWKRIFIEKWRWVWVSIVISPIDRELIVTQNRVKTPVKMNFFVSIKLLLIRIWKLIRNGWFY